MRTARGKGRSQIFMKQRVPETVRKNQNKKYLVTKERTDKTSIFFFFTLPSNSRRRGRKQWSLEKGPASYARCKGNEKIDRRYAKGCDRLYATSVKRKRGGLMDDLHALQVSLSPLAPAI